jgi:hypothetical protein
MTEKRFRELMAGDSALQEYEQDTALLGLNLIAKYMPDKIIVNGAEHDIILAVTIADIIAAGITEEDTIELRRMNWMIDESGYGLAVFV